MNESWTLSIARSKMILLLGLQSVYSDHNSAYCFAFSVVVMSAVIVLVFILVPFSSNEMRVNVLF